MSFLINRYALRGTCTTEDIKQDGQEKVRIEGPCHRCEKPVTVTANAEDWYKFEAGAFAQDCFPKMSAGEREFLISGICNKCWNNMFSLEDETDHTPGPWHCHFATAVAEQADQDWVDATGITAASEAQFLENGDRGDLVAFVPHDGSWAGNAHLIAAAPEMLTCLIQTAETIQGYLRGEWDGNEEGWQVTAEECLKVIRKAEGRE
jgi:hypothetical protein